MNIRRRLSGEERGQELVEFAMMSIVLFFLIFGIIWFGRAVSIRQALGRAAREGARVYLQSTCASCGNSNGDTAAAQTAINNALTAASIDTSNPNLFVNITPEKIVNGNPPNYDEVWGVTVSITYPVQLNSMPFIPGNGISVNSTVSMRQEF